MDNIEDQKPKRRVIGTIRAAVNTLMSHKEILFPFTFVIFIQLLSLEILYFAPRYPLNIFFAPIIRTLWSEAYLHYPLNFILLPKLFQYAEMGIYILINSFCIALSIAKLYAIVSDKKDQTKSIFRETISSYVHIALAAILSFLVVMLFFKFYGLFLNRAMKIQSTTGIFFVIKTLVIGGAPYCNLIFSVFVTALFAYVVPIIVIEKKKVFTAIIQSFKILKGSFWFSFWIAFVPTLLYVPVLLLRNSLNLESLLPELKVLVLVLSIFVIVFVDAIIYASLATYYLSVRERK